MSDNEEKTPTESPEQESPEQKGAAQEGPEQKDPEQAEQEAGDQETPEPQAAAPEAAATAEADVPAEPEATDETEPDMEPEASAETEADEVQADDDAKDAAAAAAAAADAQSDDARPADAQSEDNADEDAKEGTGAEDAPSDAADQKAKTLPKPLSPEIAALDEARKSRKPVRGKVIGWNKGGFHVALGETPAFCPRSAIAVGEPEEPESYLNQELDFTVLEIRKGGKRIVVSRVGAIRAERTAQHKATMADVKAGAVLVGTVVSLTDFGAFVDLGGVQGLLHVSEISRSRVEHPSDALEQGQPIEVKVLKVEKGGKRISLSRKALEPDPWKAIGDFKEGQEIDGKVERAEKFGVLVEIAPGLSGLIPSSKLSLPADAQPQRVFPKGKQLTVQIVSIDKKRKRISLLPEGAQVDGSKQDLQEYRKQHGEQKLGAMAAAFERAKSADST